MGTPAIGIIDLLVQGSRLVASRGEAKRKVQEGAVEVDGAKVSDMALELPIGREYRIRVGKKFARVLVKNI